MEQSLEQSLEQGLEQSLEQSLEQGLEQGLRLEQGEQEKGEEQTETPTTSQKSEVSYMDVLKKAFGRDELPEQKSRTFAKRSRAWGRGMG